MLELLGSFTIGISTGLLLAYYIAHKILEIENNKYKTNKIKQPKTEVIINSLNNGPSYLIPFNGEKAEVVYSNFMLYCRINNKIIVVPDHCVIQNKTGINS